MFDKFSRSWDLAGQCWNVLKQDKTLMVFPLLSSVAMLIVMASFALPSLGHLRAVFAHDGPHKPLYAIGFLFYLVNYCVVFFFNTALVSVALKRLDGQHATVRDGLNLALAKLPVIFLYAVIAAIVGTILRAIEERVGFIGRIIVGVIGFAWTIVTAMVVPVLAAEEVGPIEAIERSASLLRRNWGENIIGNAGIGLAMGCLFLAVVAAGAVLCFIAFQLHSVALAVLFIAAAVIALMIVGLISATLHSIYTAALYRYANDGSASEGIDAQLLAGAFRAK